MKKDRGVKERILRMQALNTRSIVEVKEPIQKYMNYYNSRILKLQDKIIRYKDNRNSIKLQQVFDNASKN